MPMQPRPISETASPSVPRLRVANMGRITPLAIEGWHVDAAKGDILRHPDVARVKCPALAVVVQEDREHQIVLDAVVDDKMCKAVPFRRHHRQRRIKLLYQNWFPH